MDNFSKETLIEMSLDGFKIQEYTEVYKTDDDGRKSLSLGYFTEQPIAEGIAQKQKDSSYYKTNKVILLTDGKIGIILGEVVELADDQQARNEIIQSALAKLTRAERQVLGL